MPMPIVFLFIFLATFRITRLVTTDAVPFEEAREKFVHRWGTYDDATDKTVSISGKPTSWAMRKIAYLWECDWCASMWVAALVVIATMQVTSIPLPVLVALSASAFTGIAAKK